MIDTSLFPHQSFPVRLEVTQENRICWFKDKVDLQKHIDRYKLDKRKIKVFYRDEKSTEPSKDDPPKVRQRTPKNSAGSTNTGRKRTKSVDKPRNAVGTPKAKPKPRKPK